MREQLPKIVNLSLVSGLVILGSSIISPVLPQYALSFSIPVALTGWAVSSFALARMGLDIPSGLLADRFGRKRIMVIGLILICASSMLSGTAQTYLWLIAGRVVQGIGSAIYMTAATTWVAQMSAGKYRGRFMSVYSGIVFASTSFGPTIGGFTAVHFGINAPFFVYGGSALLGLLATIPLKEETDSDQKARSKVNVKDIYGIITNRSFLIVCLSVMALFFLRSGIRSTLIPLYSSLNLNLTEDKIGLVLTVAAIVSSILAVPSGWISDRFGRKVSTMSCLFLSAIAVMLVPFQSSLNGLLYVMIFYGFATGLQGSIAAWPADIAPPDKLGTAMGIYRVIGDIGFFLGPITVSYVADYTGQSTITYAPFLVTTVMAVTVGIVTIWARDPVRRRHREERDSSSPA